MPGRECGPIETVPIEEQPSPFAMRPELNFGDRLVGSVRRKPTKRIVEVRHSAGAVGAAERAVEVTSRAPHLAQTDPEPAHAATIEHDETKTTRHVFLPRPQMPSK